MRLWSPSEVVTAAATAARAGVLRPLSPLTVARGGLAFARDGLSPATAYQLAAARFGRELAIADDRGSVTFAELAGSIGALAGGLRECDIGAGDRLGILCRNHRDLVRTAAAASMIGADVLLLNASFARPQLAQVLEDEHATALVYDEDLAEAACGAPKSVARFVTRRSGAGGPSAGDPALDELPAAALPWLRVAPRRPSRFVLLTSGTTGRPRGAGRPMPRSLDPVIAILERIPLRVRDTTLIAAPLFHGWGFANLGFAMMLSSSLVLQDRFEPEAALAAIARHRVRVLVAVPVMLERIIDLPEDVRRKHDTSSLEVVAVSGSALAGGLATRFMDAYGDVLYNLYGSTEAAWVSIATPGDLREAPQSAGTPPFGTELLIVDDDGAPAAAGETGHIRVRNAMLHGAPEDGGFLDTGDVGHIGEDGRLFVEGRADDMIVSGGENVYPQEVEELLATHPSIAEAAVMGVPDDRFGQRLRALVVVRDGESVSPDEVRSFVRSRLARYKVPRDVQIVDSLPRNATGKVLRKAPPDS